MREDANAAQDGIDTHSKKMTKMLLLLTDSPKAEYTMEDIDINGVTVGLELMIVPPCTRH